MTTERATEDAATVIIGEKVRAGCENAFLVWQDELNKAAARYPGFIAAETIAPTGVRAEWSVVYRFDSKANLQVWMNSATRQDRLALGAQYLDGPPTQQVLSGTSVPPDQLVTTVVTHPVDPDDVDEFLAWQKRLVDAESKFPGFRGSELFRPIDGVQSEWTALYRYDSAAAMEAWLTSSERERLLAEGAKFRDFQIRTVDNSFGSWFAFDGAGPEAPPPSQTKTSIAVWVGLYPTVVLLTLALSPVKMPLWIGMLISNLMSSVIMTFVSMPFYANPLLKRWLWPDAQTTKTSTNLRAAVLILTVMSAWAAIFYVVTTVLWKLP